MPRLATKFITSVATASQLTDFGKDEAIIFGRSNVGKSTFINLLCGQKVARTSSTPGRTRLLNFFDFSNFILVDAPGYGYAGGRKGEFEKNIIDYLQLRSQCRLIILLIDSRHRLKEEDHALIDLVSDRPLLIIATKKDKLDQKMLAAHQKEMKNMQFESYFLTGINDDASIEKVRRFLTNFFC